MTNPHPPWPLRWWGVGLFPPFLSALAMGCWFALPVVYPPASQRLGVWLVGILTGTVLLGALWLWLLFRAWRPIRQELRRTKGRLCLKCWHSLDGLGDEGRCPECGEAYIIAETIKRWKALPGWKES